MATSQIEQTADEHQEALTRVKKRRDFQSHVVAYVVINVALWVIWAVTGAGYPGRLGLPAAG
jgi:hypothetical protein